jgi:uncharacterized membrane protein
VAVASLGDDTKSEVMPASERARRRLRWAGWALIAAQLGGLLWWSTVVVHRVGLAWDFSTYYQAFWAVAHGHLNPATTMMPWPNRSFPFWQYDGEFLIWLLAPLYWIFPNHPLGFWWLQDLAIAGISAVCFRWIGELLPWEANRSFRENRAAAVGWVLTVTLLVLNPWIYWSATFAVQLEPFGALFALLTLRALTQERRTVLLWAVLTLLCGSAEVIYLVSAGLAGAWFWLRRWRSARRETSTARSEIGRPLKRSVAVTAAGVGWMILLSAVHGSRSVSSPWTVVHSDLRYLVGASTQGRLPLLRVAGHALLHPTTVITVIASHALNLWANAAPDGLLGLLSGPGFFLSAPTLLENSLLKGQDFSYPGFANLIVYPALAVGTTLLVAAVLRRRPRLGMWLGALVMLNILAWCVIWLPKTGTQYLTVDAPAAKAIRATAASIPESAEVIASQGFVGAFADRLDVHVFGGPRDSLEGPERLPVNARSVWFALSGNQGIEAPSTSATDQAIASVAALPGSRLVSHIDGLWVFRWTPRASTHSVSLGGPDLPVPGWVTGGVAASPRLSGNTASWDLSATGAAGYVASGDVWRLVAGRYVAGVEMSASAPTNVEVWDDSSQGDQLLVRRVVAPRRAALVKLQFSVGRAAVAPESTGPVPFAYTPVPAPSASTVEIRVWTPGKATVDVKSLDVRIAPRRSD